MTVHVKAYKFRFYPTAAQQKQLAVEFGCARFVYNWALSARSKAYKRRKESLNYIALSKRITHLKKTSRYHWLKDAAAGCATQKLLDLDNAFKHFFEGRAAYPRFKKRDHAQSVRYQLDQRYIAKTFSNVRGSERLAITKLGPIKLKWSQAVKGIPKMVTISRNAAGQYYASLAVAIDITPLTTTNHAIGVDVGIKDVAITSNSDKSGSPQYTRYYEKKLARAQRSLARKKKGSNRRVIARLNVAKIHQKITNSRKNFLHQLSSKLIHENQVICLEDLNIKGMVKNRKLAKSIADSSMSELRRMLEYKAKWYGRDVISINRWFPSSKTCSECNHVLTKLDLATRNWICPECSAQHDRDINAANNILTEGLRQYREEHGNWPLGIVMSSANEQGVVRAA